MISAAKDQIIKRIVDIEIGFFKSMNTEEPVPENTLPALCRMRWMTYSCLSETTLQLWLRDLEAAKAEQRNTMIEKYALIDDLIPAIQDSPLIPKIVGQEVAWMEEIAQKYPKTVQGHEGNRDLFKKYMLCELQSWSPEALLAYWDDILAAVEAGENLAEIRYDNLYESLGRGTLKQFNESLA